MILLGQRPIDENAAGIFENCPLVAELKLKIEKKLQSFGFSISARPPEGAFQMLMHHFHLWTFDQKESIRLFKDRVLTKLLGKKHPEVAHFCSFLAHL